MRVLGRWFTNRKTADRAVEMALRMGFYAGWAAAVIGELDIDGAFAAYEAHRKGIVAGPSSERIH